MFRTLILLIAVGFVIWIVSRMLNNKLGSDKKQESKRAQQIKNIVQCQQCQTFIPEDRAVRDGDLIFCSQQHLEEWKQSH